jgi:hypothetical protein
MPDDQQASYPRAIADRTTYDFELNQLLDRAQSSLKIFDAALSATFNSVARYDAMRRLLLAGRQNRVQIILHDASAIERHCPRVLLLLRQFGQCVDVRCTHLDARGVYDPFVIGDDKDCVRRFHFDGPRGEAIRNDTLACGPLVEKFQALLSASETTLTSTTLGL